MNMAMAVIHGEDVNIGTRANLIALIVIGLLSDKHWDKFRKLEWA